MSAYQELIQKALSGESLCQIKMLIYRDWCLNGANELGEDAANELALVLADSVDAKKAMAEIGVVCGQLRAELASLQAERDAWRRAIQSLTPGGSEFTEPQECERWIRDRNESQWKVLKKKVVEARTENGAAKEIARQAAEELATLRAELDAAKQEAQTRRENLETMLRRLMEKERECNKWMNTANCQCATLDTYEEEIGKLVTENASLKRRLELAEAKESEE